MSDIMRVFEHTMSNENPRYKKGKLKKLIKHDEEMVEKNFHIYR